MEANLTVVKNKLVQYNRATVTLGGLVTSVDVKHEVCKEVQYNAMKVVTPMDVQRAVTIEENSSIPLPAIVKKQSLETEKAILKDTIFKREPGDVCASVCSEKSNENSVRVTHCHEQRFQELLQGTPKKEVMVDHSSSDTGVQNDPEEGEEIEVEIERPYVVTIVDDTNTIQNVHDNTLASCTKEPLGVKTRGDGCQSTSIKIELPRGEAQDGLDITTNNASSCPSVSDTSGFAPAVVISGTETSAMLTSTSPGGGQYEMYPSTLPMAAYIVQSPGGYFLFVFVFLSLTP
jgi:hypothetical protein